MSSSLSNSAKEENYVPPACFVFELQKCVLFELLHKLKDLIATLFSCCFVVAICLLFSLINKAIKLLAIKAVSRILIYDEFAVRLLLHNA